MRRMCQAILLLSVAFSLSGCRQRIERLEWPVMGTVAAIQLRGRADSAAEARTIVQDCFAEMTRLLNAHDPDSELCRLAPLSEAEILARCNPSVSNCYAAAFRLARETGQAFNPRWRGPKTLDLGAIAKGFAVDVAYARLTNRTNLTTDCLIDLGGNLRSVRGDWRTAIDHSNAMIQLAAGEACATSGEYFRGKHIRDGRTGTAVTNELMSVTVVHPTSAMLADGLSTTLFILGRERGERFLKAHYPEAVAHWVWYNTGE